MNAQCCLRQEATNHLLQNVSRYCAECYREFREGEHLFYDMQNYRYLCEECAETLKQQSYEVSEEVEEPEGMTLF